MDSSVAFLLFPVSLACLIVAAHYFLHSVRRLGVVLGIRPFVVGAFIVTFGTTFPELTISLFSVWGGILTVPVAQTVGSNIANVLLVLGVAAVISRRFAITKNLIDVELPLVAVVTLLFVFIIFDGLVSPAEGLFLLAGFLCYSVYIFRSEDNRSYPMTSGELFRRLRGVPRHVGVFFIAIAVIAVAAHYTVSSVGTIAMAFGVSEGVVAITVLALGTSLPEVVVSVQAAMRNEVELVVGNVIGASIFNILFVVGLPAVVTGLVVDAVTLSVGVPVLIGVTLLFVISGISNRLHMWEGLFYILLYLFFVGKMVGIL